MQFSLIIPVFNRPEEVQELLGSLSQMDYQTDFEVVIVEDGSTNPCKNVVDEFQHKLSIAYYFKENSGPGDSRNFGMKVAKGDYFLIFDSDCIIPKQYLKEVDFALNQEFVDCFGGPDEALDSFSDVQKAINFAMTSFMTTGGIRGGSEKIDKFQPRSFNMGLSKKAFEASGGFGNIHPGEDPDLSIRLWNLGFKTRLITTAYVYHKRRIDWSKFYKQVNKFGKTRPILNSWYPKYSKLVYFFPTVFLLGFFVAVLSLLLWNPILISLYATYFVLLFISAILSTGSLKIAFLALLAVCIQFYGYGTGFLKSFFFVQFLKSKPEVIFPDLFFKP